MIGALRFCMVTTFYPPYHFGGDAMHVYRLAEGLAASGHRVDVIHSRDAFRLARPRPSTSSFRHHPNVRLHALESTLPFWSALAAHQLGRPALYRRRLERILKAGDYDAVHYHNVSLAGAPGIFSLGRGVKLYTAHEYWLVCPTHVLYRDAREPCTRKRCLRCTTLHYRRPPQLWRYTGALARGLEHVRCVIAPSRFARDRLRSDGIERPFALLPHFVPDPAERAAERPGSERAYFLYAGRLEPLKGVEDLLELFRAYRDADLLIAGSGSLESRLRAAVRKLPHVRLLGSVHPDDLEPLYRGAVAVLVPSRCYETFGLSAAEGMRVGTPAVVRRVGALPEIVEEGGGLSFGGLAECRRALESLLGNPALRRELSARAEAIARHRWSAAVYLDRYLSLVRGLRDRSGGSELAASWESPG